MKKLTLLLFLISNYSYSFTLSEAQGDYFSDNEIDIHIAPTDCSGAGFSTSKLKSMVEGAVADYWNAVPTSALVLDVRGINASMDIDGMTHGTAINSVVPNNAIVAGCNDDASDFTNPAILGSAVISCTGGNCRSVLILNANNSSLNNMSTAEVEAVIAHEIGHAIGIGHSEYKYNLMYYSTGDKSQEWLGQDDVDAVTYLYPHEPKLSCLLGSFGTIALDPPTGPGKFSLQFLLALLLSMLIGGKLRNIKSRNLGINNR